MSDADRVCRLSRLADELGWDIDGMHTSISHSTVMVSCNESKLRAYLSRNVDVWTNINIEFYPLSSSFKIVYSGDAKKTMRRIEEISSNLIKETVNSGVRVYYESNTYEVIKTRYGSSNTYDIVCSTNGYRVGLTWMDGSTLNGKIEKFYIGT